MKITHPFEPIINEDSKVLILGSFPSVKSREIDFYYGHVKNRFWKIISNVLNIKVPVTVEEKKNMLLLNKIAIWDTIKSCEIIASSDASIKNVKVNDIEYIVKKYKIKFIIFNGNAAYKFYKRYIGSIYGINEYVLPSTSPANAKITYENLLRIWKETLELVL